MLPSRVYALHGSRRRPRFITSPTAEAHDVGGRLVGHYGFPTALEDANFVPRKCVIITRLSGVLVTHYTIYTIMVRISEIGAAVATQRQHYVEPMQAINIPLLEKKEKKKRR